jgi:hypothetical protein
LLRSIILLSQQFIDGVVRRVVGDVIDRGIEPIAIPSNDAITKPFRLGKLSFGDQAQEGLRRDPEIRRGSIDAQQARGGYAR